MNCGLQPAALHAASHTSHAPHTRASQTPAHHTVDLAQKNIFPYPLAPGNVDKAWNFMEVGE